jgi:hypothetical protein
MLQKFTKRKKSIAISAYPVSAGQDAESMQRNTKSSVENYSKRWFEYPYATATNVAEMKVEWNIPLLFFATGSQDRELWRVTDHEFGHGWFPMIVGSNERLFAWMDEGLNTFINSLSVKISIRRINLNDLQICNEWQIC